mmetsp:Transcript_28224/g.50030  ORF Transcript_28224/g.50030 Transcript_28224/m.50030 type:complete len:299 (+) Transcript_28224:901-1797(+)
MSPFFGLPFFCLERMTFVSSVDVISHEFCQTQSLPSAFHFVLFVPWFLGNGTTVMHRVQKSDIIGNPKTRKSKVHEYALHGHTCQFATSSVSTLRGECGSDFSVRRSPSTGLRKVIPELFHAVGNASQVGGCTRRHGIGPINIIIRCKRMIGVPLDLGIFPRGGWAGNDTNSDVHAVQQEGSLCNEIGNVFCRASRSIEKDEDPSISFGSIQRVGVTKNRQGLVTHVQIDRGADFIHQGYQGLEMRSGKVGVQVCLGFPLFDNHKTSVGLFAFLATNKVVGNTTRLLPSSSGEFVRHV